MSVGNRMRYAQKDVRSLMLLPSIIMLCLNQNSATYVGLMVLQSAYNGMHMLMS